MGKWQTQQINQDVWHVVPTNDLKPHVTTRSCKCQPFPSEDDEDIWLHNSYDGREFFEDEVKGH